uniref:NADH-ubiquinone oxidoreductase chain 4 n=1 Tax=Aegilops tauschii subsp. strangulata TaxID=200361 RepID=A0A453GT90_AEGTS
MGIDGRSLFFMILTTFLIPICISVGWSGMRSFGKEYITAFLIREFLMNVVSCMDKSTNLIITRSTRSDRSRERTRKTDPK